MLVFFVVSPQLFVSQRKAYCNGITVQVVSTLAITYLQSSFSGTYKCGIEYDGAIVHSETTKLVVGGWLLF